MDTLKLEETKLSKPTEEKQQEKEEISCQNRKAINHQSTEKAANVIRPNKSINHGANSKEGREETHEIPCNKKMSKKQNMQRQATAETGEESSKYFITA